MNGKVTYQIPTGVSLADDVEPYIEDRQWQDAKVKLIGVKKVSATQIEVEVEVDTELRAVFTTTRGTRNPSLGVSIVEPNEHKARM